MRRCILHNAHAGEHIFIDSTFSNLPGECQMTEPMNSIETIDERGGKIGIIIFDGYMRVFKNSKCIAKFQIGPMFVRELKEALDAHVLPLTEETERKRRGLNG
jgi:hypothetical protein